MQREQVILVKTIYALVFLIHVHIVNPSISFCACQEDQPRPGAPGGPGQAPRPAAGVATARP